LVSYFQRFDFVVGIEILEKFVAFEKILFVD